MRRIFVVIITNLILLMTYGCSMPGKVTDPLPTPATTSTSTQPSISTETSLPAYTVTPILTSTETPMASATPFVPFAASVWADNVNVRINPGYLFPAIRLLPKNTNLSILGKAPGGEWMFARTPDGSSGWVLAQLIESTIDLQAVPIIEPQDVQLVKGQVKDLSGTPIQGVGFTVVQGTGDHAPTNTVLTDSNGEFFSFMPSNVHGEWTISYVAIACNSNVWSDPSCGNYKDPYRGLVEPQSTVVTLPQSEVLAFTWK
jgi:SH3-like domain-containing protein